MTSKSMKPSRPAKLPELTEEQKAQQAQFRILQRRETFAMSALNSILQGTGDTFTADDAPAVAKTAVAIADAMLAELFGAVLKRDTAEG